MPRSLTFTFRGCSERLGPKTFTGTLRGARCCASVDRSGRRGRCRRIVYIGRPYCSQHARSFLGLRIGPSAIPGAGMGLFAHRPSSSSSSSSEPVFQRRQRIAPYLGEVITTRNLAKRYGTYTAPYALEACEGVCLDAALIRSLGSIANGSNSTSVASNAYFSGGQMDDDVESFLVARRDIMHGEEIIADYGPEYFGEKVSAYEHCTMWR